MGVLDDAIREHLDLKRRRGADPAEVERAEREALGPARRGPEPAADEASVAGELPYDDDLSAAPLDHAAAGQHDEELWADEHEPEWEDALETGHPPPAFEPALEAHPAETAPIPATEPAPAPAAGYEPAPAIEPEPASTAIPEPHPAAPASDSAHPPAGDETLEYRVEDALAHEERKEDVLEETPEFLQDTPDHDRLWFEQRPPRDFDFDG